MTAGEQSSRRCGSKLSYPMHSASFPRRQQWRTFPLSVRALVLSMSTACFGDLDPCPGAQKGVRFEIEVLGSQTPEPSCHEAWGLGAGTLIEGTIGDIEGEADCKSGVPEVEGVGGWSWVRDRDGRVIGGQTMEGQYILTKNACSARLWLKFASDPPLACDARRGEVCRFQAGITAIPGMGSDCPEFCSGFLDVRAQRL